METKNRNYDLRKLSQKYPNMWIAISRDHKIVFSFGKSLRDVAAKVKGKDVVFLKLLPSNSFYMPGAYNL